MASAERRVLAKARIQTAARTVHIGERQEPVIVAQSSVLNDLSGATHEIVGLARTCRTSKKSNARGGTNRKTCMSAVGTDGTRVKSGKVGVGGIAQHCA